MTTTLVSKVIEVIEEGEEEEEGMSREDVLGASAIIFFVAFFGLIFNMLGITVVLKNPVLKNSFGSLCLSHSIANSGVLFVFFVWSAPITYIQLQNTEGMLNKLLGQLNILCWDACVYSHLAISFNRFFSIAVPAKANYIFSRRNTYVIIGLVWCIAMCHITPYFWYNICYIYYDPISWTWNFADTECGHVISTYTDYYTSVAIFCAMSTVDISTLVLLVIHRKHTHFTSGDDAIKRRNVEIRFFIQSCLQGILFFYEIFNFYYVSTLNTNQWYVFMTSTFAWELCHCLDGFVVVLFHFRRRLFLGDQLSRIGFFGIVITCLALITISKSTRFNSSYGTLSFNHSIFNFVLLFIYLLWVAPTTYVQSTSTTTLFGKIVGILFLYFFIGLIYSHLILSFNQFITIVMPAYTNTMFSHKSSKIFIISVWIISFLHVIPMFFYDTCWITYDPIVWLWSIGMSKCGIIYKTYVIRYWTVAVLLLTNGLNIITLIYFRMKPAALRRNNEIRLFIQTSTRTILFLITLVSANFITTFFLSRILFFCFSTLAWQLYFLYDSLIIVILHFKSRLLADVADQHSIRSFINVEVHPHNNHHHHHIHHNSHSKVDTF